MIVMAQDEVLQQETPEGVVSFFLKLTKTIEDCLKTPVRKNGNLLLKTLYEYSNNLDDYLSVPQTRSQEKIFNSTSLLVQLLDCGVPSFLKQEISFDHLKVMFEWNDRSTQELFDVIKLLKTQWENIESFRKRES